ncbi:MAG TPA: 2-C-methyl-D-erythritol 4-phosphate cytidylyltransferase [Solirubrobacterales bacterium]|nr:2-C-methyl-D-erythritol 4-phosphate cytidylyltransferase [Solirubrobacterales bacterium]
MTAVIAAAGSGERLGAGGPKAFVPLAGQPMVEWSLDAFGACESVAAIVVAVPPGMAEEASSRLPAASSRHPNIRQVGPDDGSTLVVEGGATRAQSVASALAVVETGLVAIHDAARPLITPGLVEAIVATLEANPEAAGAIAATPVTDTVKQVARSSSPAFSPYSGENAGLSIEATLDRSRLWAAQTPQIFRTEALRRALEVNEATRDAATDEAMLVEAAGGRVLLHRCGPENLKVTTPLDLRVAAMLLSERDA